MFQTALHACGVRGIDDKRKVKEGAKRCKSEIHTSKNDLDM